MKFLKLTRLFARRFDPKQAYESYKNGFADEKKENPHLKDPNYFKDFEEVIETNPVVNSRGLLTICPTPIGNLRDISIRQYQTLKSADILACEDTRLSGLLLKLLSNLTFSESKDLEFPPKNLPDSPEVDEYSVFLTEDFLSHTFKSIRESKERKDRGIMVSFNSYNQEQRTPKLISAMKSGIRVVLISDAGTPLVSDPGFSLVQSAVRNGISIESLPGPVAAVVALTMSGFSTENFYFLGFMPKIGSKKLEKLSKMKASGSTCVVYESSHRIIDTLERICEAFGDFHQVFIAREMTKMFEKHYRGNCKDVLIQLVKEEEEKKTIYGELTLVVAPVFKERNKNVVEVDVKEMMKVFDNYLNMSALDLGQLGHYVTGLNQRKLARFVQNSRSNQDTSSEEEEKE
jgi:16S rRNA (cytidine1402-2'-O)-methyltransferase